MAAIPQEDFLLVAAIDFGTTYSGYAFSLRHDFEEDPLKVSSNNWTAPSGGLVSLKTPTTLLLKPDGSFDSFGYDAENRFTELAEDDKHEGYYYFRRFKMSLFQQAKRLTRDTKLKEISGKRELPAIDVFAHSIRYLKKHLEDTLDTRGTTINKAEIQWVLTVPAIWDDPAKQFMREAAEKADIFGGQLMIALEPEAASMFCKFLPVEKLEGAVTGLSCFAPGSQYMVLDAGGGTVDITVHEVQRDGTLKELDSASGGAWGGTYVDQCFREMIEEIVGKGVLEGFAHKNTLDYITLFREFETKKRNVPEDPSTKITIKVPQPLIEFFEGEDEGAFKQALTQSQYKGKVISTVDKLRISNECFRSFFKQAGDGIINHVRNLLQSPKVRGTKNILMVGGFSESPLLQKMVREAFTDCRVIIPPEAGLCVLKGAVIFGHKPKTIVGRVAKYTYGIETTMLFKKGKHKPEKLFKAEGEDRCKDLFSRHVTIGDMLKLDEVQSKSDYVPIYKNQKSMALPVYSSSERNPEYTDDYGCRYLGTLNVTFTDPAKGSEGVECSMVFGGTELRVLGKEKSNNKETWGKFDFLSNEP